MYPAEMVAPMKADLTDVGFEQLETVDQVSKALENTPGTTLVVINSVCGCAAGNARPAVKFAVQQSPKKPNNLTTAFAGVDKDAVNKARSFFSPYPPSSPSIALMKDGALVHFIERHQIEGRHAQEIANDLLDAFEKHC